MCDGRRVASNNIALEQKRCLMSQDEFYEDWRHRDRLTWQIPSVVVAVGGLLVAAAFAANNEVVKAFLLGFGIALSSFMTTMLAQNLYYQYLDMHWLDNSTRPGKPIPPHISPREGFLKRLSHVFSLKRWGSTLLLFLCLSISGSLTFLFIKYTIDCYYDLAILLLPIGSITWFFWWLWRDPL